MKTDYNDTILIRSYLQLRRAVGYLGMALPFTLLLGKIILKGPGIEPSLSDYYYTIMGDVFVGSLWAFGIFLWSYKGYPKSPDNRAGNIASIGALGTALFPTMPKSPTLIETIIGYAHYTFAITFLASLAYFCLSLFTRSDQKILKPKKQLRNIIYRFCGSTILICLAAIIIYNIIKMLSGATAPYKGSVVFWLETIAIMSFGFSWIVKGKVIFEDKE